MGGRSEFVVVANRLPVEETGEADERWSVSPGGLVTALYPLLARRGGVWVGWAGAAGDAPEPFRFGGVRLEPVALSAEEVERYYEGESNSTIWPLYHSSVEPPIFNRSWHEDYRRVNARFAEAASKVAASGAIVWVHDYQLQLMPAMLRALRPDLRIGFFLHVPFPPLELFMRLPMREEILRGLLGADLVGFQEKLGAQNFLRLARHVLGLRYSAGTIELDGRLTRAGAFPISIDVAEMRGLAADADVRARAAEIRRELGEPETVVLGVDRLDYTKGIEVRLKAFRELLEEGTLRVPGAVMVQVATPSRERVAHYEELRTRVEQETGRINGDFGAVGAPAVHYVHQSHGRRELAALYRAADVLMVTPFRDGMNLVAKEYVAVRTDGGGALVLSEFAGAANELRHAFLCNPYDIASVKEALVRAIRADPPSRERRLRHMQRHLQSHDLGRWAETFLTQLETTAGERPGAELSRTLHSLARGGVG